MTLTGLLIVAAVLVALMLWATRNLDNKRGRCPDCGADRARRPHLPHCKYWRNG